MSSLLLNRMSDSDKDGGGASSQPSSSDAPRDSSSSAAAAAPAKPLVPWQQVVESMGKELGERWVIKFFGAFEGRGKRQVRSL